MGLEISDKINIAGVVVSAFFALCSLLLAIAVFRYARRKDRIKGPKMAIYAEEHLSNTITSLDLYDIKFSRCIQNYGDIPQNIYEEPEIFVYDINDNLLVTTKNPLKVYGIAVGASDCRHIDFVVSNKAENWHHATIKFNAFFYNKKRVKTPVDVDEFEFLNKDYKPSP